MDKYNQIINRIDKTTRPGSAGHEMARAIIEAVNLMYQNKTALSYLRELILTLEAEKQKRENEIPKKGE